MLNNIKKYGLKLFDVSLRDGLQSIPRVLTINEKKDIFHRIINKYTPDNIEVGSIVSKKVLPQFHDSIELFNHGRMINTDNMYLLIPNYKNYVKAKNTVYNIRNISLLTSTSESFIKKNTKMSEAQNLANLRLILEKRRKNEIDNIKLYISCISECPIDGKIDNDIVVEKILSYFSFSDINEFCLSDTCGTLSYIDYKYIIDKLLSKTDPSRIGLHLHIGDNSDEIKKIIKYSINNDIKKFDVSCLDNSGGCVVTMKKDRINSNLTYEQLDSMLEK
uniref:Pyruvate carboxyltransferase domain-containing protein n=1 Tax=viral metagenome TaxID=1070528 RepID=A0A6C0BRZ5_9ZZZZ